MMHHSKTAPLYSKTETYFFVGLMLVICVISTMGWIFNLPHLNRFFPEWVPIQPHTISCFALLALYLWRLPSKDHILSRIIMISCTVVVLCIALFTLATFIFNTPHPFSHKIHYLNELNFLILCGGMIALLGNDKQRQFAQYFFLVSLLMPLIIMLSYFYNITDLFRAQYYGNVSFMSASLFLIFSFTALFSNPSQGIMQIFLRKTPSSRLAKYLIPGAILLPSLLGNFWLEGQIAGFYTLRVGLFFAISLIIFTVVPVIFTTTIWLNKLEEQLIIERRKAEAATQAKSAFLAAMSHEIRTPLNGVIGMTDVLQETPLSDEQHRYLDTLRLSGEAVLHVINDILDFSKIESGSIDIEQTNVELLPLIHEAIDIIAVNARKKGLAIHTEIPSTIPATINGDPTRLRQILINLLNNAVKFTEHGSVTVSMSIKPKQFLRFAIQDTGIGIAPNIKHRLFQRFSQGDASTTRKYGGTGLGLAICKRLIEAMGGQIDVVSKEGKGSTFWFTLPLKKPIDTPSPSRIHKNAVPTPLLSPEQTHASILIAEDNDINQHVVETLLKKWGFTRIFIATNGKEVLDCYEKNTIDLILMDCEMPNMDGYDTTRNIRQRNTQQPYIIAMTAHALEGDKEKCIAAGMNDYLAKPLRKHELINMLLKWLPNTDRKKTKQ